MVDSTNLPDVDINQIATDLNGKMDRDGVNATASVCVESWHDENGNYYRVYSDGWCEQGGVVTVSTVTLFKPYKDTTYIVLLGYRQGTDGCWFVSGRTTSSFQQYIKYTGINSRLDTTGNFWEAKGYIR